MKNTQHRRRRPRHELRQCLDCGEWKEGGKFRKGSPIFCDCCVGREWRRTAPIPEIVFKDCTDADNRGKIKRRNDLTIEIIAVRIKNGCWYCGETAIRTTLDRIDNMLPHTVANTIPACYRCNLLRGTMPFPAWLTHIPACQHNRIHNLNGAWLGSTQKRMVRIFTRPLPPRHVNGQVIRDVPLTDLDSPEWRALRLTVTLPTSEAAIPKELLPEWDLGRFVAPERQS